MQWEREIIYLALPLREDQLGFLSISVSVNGSASVSALQSARGKYSGPEAVTRAYS